MMLSRKFIEENTVEYLRTAGGTRPDLRVVDTGDSRIVVKDFRHSDLLFRVIVGPTMIRREAGALRKLKGVTGVPELIEHIDRYALAMEHVPATSLEKLKPGQLTQEFYTDLRRVIDDMHACGVAHCDLRSRGNLMVGEDGKPYVVDFAACVFRGRGWNPFFRWLFNQFVPADRNAILRVKQRLSPELLTDEDTAGLAINLPFERPARAFGQTVRRITRKLLTKKTG